jgi:hypothetical protein
MIEYVTKWTERQRQPYAQVYVFKNSKVLRRLPMHEVKKLIDLGLITEVKLIAWLNNYEATRKIRTVFVKGSNGVKVDEPMEYQAKTSKPAPKQNAAPKLQTKEDIIKAKRNELYKYLEGMYRRPISI